MCVPMHVGRFETTNQSVRHCALSWLAAAEIYLVNEFASDKIKDQTILINLNGLKCRPTDAKFCFFQVLIKSC